MPPSAHLHRVRLTTYDTSCPLPPSPYVTSCPLPPPPQGEVDSRTLTNTVSFTFTADNITQIFAEKPAVHRS